MEFERYREAHRTGDPAAILLAPHLSFAGADYDAGFKGGAGFGAGSGGVSRDGYERALRQCHRILVRTRPRITGLDWRQLGLERLTEDDVVLLDPPYPNSNIRSYSHESVDYEQLVDVLLRARFRWPLCGYLHPLLHRLGTPIWARDVQVLCVRTQDDRDGRTECLWGNFAPDASNARQRLPLSVDGKWRLLTDAASLSFSALDDKIEAGLQTVADDWNALVPYLLEMHRRLCAPGRHTDLRKGAPANLTWEEWVQSKRGKLGRSLRSVRRLLQGRTEASQRALERRPPANLAGGSVKILPSAMGIAFEMARLILEMRSRSRNTSSNKRRLERLASQFLSVAERRSMQRNESTPAERIGIANRTSGGVMWKM